MEKVTIYKIKLQGGGTYYSLKERIDWNQYIKGHTSNIGEYLIPKGFEIAESQNGELYFYKNGYPWKLVGAKGVRITDGNGTIIALRKAIRKEVETLEQKICGEIEKKIMKTGKMGTETVAITLILTEKEIEIFKELDKYSTKNYFWEIEGNELTISYTENILM